MRIGDRCPSAIGGKRRGRLAFVGVRDRNGFRIGQIPTTYDSVARRRNETAAVRQKMNAGDPGRVLAQDWPFGASGKVPPMDEPLRSPHAERPTVRGKRQSVLPTVVFECGCRDWK